MEPKKRSLDEVRDTRDWADLCLEQRYRHWKSAAAWGEIVEIISPSHEQTDRLPQVVRRAASLVISACAAAAAYHRTQGNLWSAAFDRTQSPSG